jgi:hypothetical protein
MSDRIGDMNEAPAKSLESSIKKIVDKYVSNDLLLQQVRQGNVKKRNDVKIKSLVFITNYQQDILNLLFKDLFLSGAANHFYGILPSSILNDKKSFYSDCFNLYIGTKPYINGELVTNQTKCECFGDEKTIHDVFKHFIQGILIQISDLTSAILLFEDNTLQNHQKKFLLKLYRSHLFILCELLNDSAELAYELFSDCRDIIEWGVHYYGNKITNKPVDCKIFNHSLNDCKELIIISRLLFAQAKFHLEIWDYCVTA